MYEVNKTQFKKNNEKNCYAMSNGLGGFTSSGIFNNSIRKHQGYLVASFLPPIERYLLLKRIDEKIIVNDEILDFEEQEYTNKLKKGHKYLSDFSFNNYPTLTYEASGIVLVKKIVPIYGHNAVCINYHIEARNKAKIILTPLFNYRQHGENNERQDFDYNYQINKDQISFCLPNERILYYSFNKGLMEKREQTFTGKMKFKYDYETGDERVDISYVPFDFVYEMSDMEILDFNIICSLDECLENKDYVELYNERMNDLIAKSKIDDDFAQRLVKSADQFICYRQSTSNYTILAGLPWFTDWGRDTMIAYTGLTLVTKRFDEALSILKSFAKYEKNGLIPNMFPDYNDAPLYNTVDASLLYVNACYKYLEYTSDYASIKELFGTLKNIIYYYEKGTDFSIYMSKDGLIHAGSDMDQVTWMDVRAHGVVVTPRHGHPVEINAMWYNALMIMYTLASKFDDIDAKHYLNLSNKVKRSFKQFIADDCGLLDVYEPSDHSVRPNQLYAYALPFKVVSKDIARKSFKIVQAELYNVFGIRSLSKKDSRFIPNYTGSLYNRDMAYHMGTTWGHLLGIYVDGLFYVKSHETAMRMAQKMFKAFSNHLTEGCLDSVAEIFDGLKARESKGCFAQAWGVGEVLRAYYENILK